MEQRRHRGARCIYFVSGHLFLARMASHCASRRRRSCSARWLASGREFFHFSMYFVWDLSHQSCCSGVIGKSGLYGAPGAFGGVLLPDETGESGSLRKRLCLCTLSQSIRRGITIGQLTICLDSQELTCVDITATTLRSLDVSLARRGAGLAQARPRSFYRHTAARLGGAFAGAVAPGAGAGGAEGFDAIPVFGAADQASVGALGGLPM
jgi:hypothetical protein